MSFATKTINVDSKVLFELIKKVDEIESLVETLDIQSDNELIKELEQSKKEFAQKQVKNVKTKAELAKYLSSLG